MQFIINTLTFWEEPPRARHQLTFALSKKFKVAYVAANKIGALRIEVVDLKNNIILIQPYFPISVKIRYRIPVLNELYQLWLISWLKKNYSGTEIINFDFSAYLIPRKFSKVYYYCNDNFTSISRKIDPWPIFNYIRYCEKNVARRSFKCFGTSPMITDNLRRFNPGSYEIPLGGPNIDEFHVKPQLKTHNKDKINIGLVGFISNSKISAKLINAILEKINCIVTLIGPVDKSFYDGIIHRDRVESLGVLTGQDLYEAVNQFDIAIAPYLESKAHEGNIPNKIFIYLALGKPVVITEMIGLKKMNLPEKLIYMVNDLKNFPEIIRNAYSENDDSLIMKRIEFGRENTWDKRAEKFLSIINGSHSVKLQPELQ